MRKLTSVLMGLFALMLTGALPLLLFVHLASVCGRIGPAGSVYAPVSTSAGSVPATPTVR
jgi:hypothetical protein